MNRIFYVYQHVFPETGKIFYIGKGCHGRAWDVTRARNENKDHQNWMISLTQQGYIPTDWVRIIKRNCTEKEALTLEHHLIDQEGPIFNKQTGENQHQAKLTNKQAIEIYDLTKSKKPNSRYPLHKEIANKYGVSLACVSMISSVKQWRSVLIPYIKAKNETAT